MLYHSQFPVNVIEEPLKYYMKSVEVEKSEITSYYSSPNLPRFLFQSLQNLGILFIHHGPHPSNKRLFHIDPQPLNVSRINYLSPPPPGCTAQLIGLSP